MPTYEVPASVQQNWAKRFGNETRMHPCGEGIGQGLTCQMATRRLFPRGYRCPEHAPAAPAVDPTRTLVALQARARAALAEEVAA